MKGRKSSKETKGLLDEQQRILKKIGARVKELRIQKGYTSYDVFAYENEINRTQYGRYERGEDMLITSLVKVLKALDISLADFFSEGFEE